MRITEQTTGRQIESLSLSGIPFKLHFIEKKAFGKAERHLLMMTLKLIIKYGSMGGKTKLKPSEKDHKNIAEYGGGRHLDYGIIDTLRDKSGNDISEITSTTIYTGEGKNEVRVYLNAFDKSATTNEFDWPDLRNFWFVIDGYVKRNEHNKIVNRDNNTGEYINTPSEVAVFLGGFIKREKGKFSRKSQNTYKDINSASKKIFSFHGIKSDAKISNNETLKPSDNRVIQGIKRCFGYTQKDTLDDVVKLIEGNSQLKGKIKKGTEVLNDL